MHLARKRPEVAVPLYRRSLAIFEKRAGADAPALASSLTGLADALAAVGDSHGAVAAARRAVDVTGRDVRRDVAAGARFHLAMAEWSKGTDRPAAVARAREARAELAALPFPSEELPRIDRGLARARSH